jgi:hypothetical protein
VEGPAEWDSDKMMAVLAPLLDSPVSQPGR